MINFLKMSGAGNDFIIVDERQKSLNITSEKISKMCQRNNIGCDQFIVLKNSTNSDAPVDVLMEIFNPDGSKSGACGNATRCVAAILMEEKNLDEVNIKTSAGILNCQKNTPGSNLIAVNMGKPKLDWNLIPLSVEKNTADFVVQGFEKYHFSAVNMGNPHIVTFVNEDLSDQDFLRDGRALEINPLFPTKTNVEFAQILSPNHIKVRVWERGAGETLACGSGACAVAVAAIQRNIVSKERIKISFKGGDLFINQLEDDSVIMSGGYSKIFAGVLDESFFS
ncbi:MAG: diaminopimelate epimerase [Rickettsiales bacterium]|jgi:diaminopimelate epimerase